MTAACVALLGYHSADKFPRPPIPPVIALAFLLVGIALLSSGCRLGGFALNVKSATFGSVGLAFDSGSIGNLAVSHTNALHQLPPS